MAGIREWWQSLGESPEPLQPGQRLALWLVALFTAVTRWLALARSPWDWDEALFMMGLRHYDVLQHHPHPPGFPLFIGSAKIFQWAGLSDFHALQALSLAGAVAIVPVTVFFARELRCSFATALIAGLFLAFFPNVWLFGGTALSDVPSMTLSILAAALLLRGCRSDGAFFAGVVVLGISAGFRPQNLAIGFAPAVIATFRGLPRRWLRPFAGVAVIALIVAGSYGAAAHLSGGWASYSEAVHAHEHYITTVDSYHNADRPPLWRLFPHFFVYPYSAPPINAAVTVLVLLSLGITLITLRAPMLAALAAFGPFCVVAWLMLDHFSASRFSIAYAPLFALLSADGVALCTWARPRFERLLAAGLAILMIVWTWPAIREVHLHDSPTVASTTWLREHFDPRTSTLFVHDSMGPFAAAFLGNLPYVATGDTTPVATAISRPGDLFLIEAAPPGGSAMVFSRPRAHLLPLVRDRYFEVSIIRLQQLVTFGDGWYDLEGDGAKTYRWMARRSVASLPPIRGKASLRLQLYVPLDALKAAPTITITLNGQVLDRIHATVAEFEKSWQVEAREDQANVLVIETDRVVNPRAEHLSDDARDLGVRASAIDWGSVHQGQPVAASGPRS